MSDRVTVIADWKKWGSFIGVEYVAQASRYARCPYLYDKVNQQQTLMPPVEYGLVCWVGAQGVQAKLVLNSQELDEGAAMHRKASELAVYAARYAFGKPQTPSRYEHPLKPGNYLWSVTEVNSKVFAKPGLMNWYHKKGVEGVLTLLKEYGAQLPGFSLPAFCDLSLDQVLQELETHKLRPTDLRDKAGAEGTAWHKLAMFYLQGKKVDLTQAPPAHVEMATKFAAWCNKVKLEPVAVEQMVYEEAPHEIAGTLDCLAMVDRGWVEQEWERLHNQEGKDGTT